MNAPQIGALGVHYYSLVHVMAPENVSSCITHYSVSLGIGSFWALVESANNIVRRPRRAEVGL